MSEHIQRVLVWPAVLRLLHLMMAASVMILLLTGMLINSGMILNQQLYLHLLQVWHVPAGNVLVFILLARFFLLFSRKDVAGWRALIPENLGGVISTATFYLSLGRMSLPGYYAHNPLWKIIYLLWFVLLAVEAFSGLLLESAWLRSVFRTDTSSMLFQHELLLGPLAVIVIAHVVTALLHDWKSSNGEISAINNGYKFFSTDNSKQGMPSDVPVEVSIDSLLKQQQDNIGSLSPKSAPKKDQR